MRISYDLPLTAILYSIPMGLVTFIQGEFINESIYD